MLEPSAAKVARSDLRGPRRSNAPGLPDNNRVEADHGRLKARIRPMRGLKTDPTATVIVNAHAFIQNLRRGFYELAVDVRPKDRLVAAFAELAMAI